MASSSIERTPSANYPNNSAKQGLDLLINKLREDKNAHTPFEVDVQRHTSAILDDLRFAALVTRRCRNTPLQSQFIKETIHKFFPSKFIHFNEFTQHYDGDFLQFMQLGANACWRALSFLEQRKTYSLTYSLLLNTLDPESRANYAHNEIDSLSGEFKRRMSLQSLLAEGEMKKGYERLYSAYKLMDERYDQICDRISSCPIAADILKLQYLYDAVRVDDSLAPEKRKAAWIKSQMLSLICDGTVMTKQAYLTRRAHIALNEPLDLNSSDDECDDRVPINTPIFSFGLEAPYSVAQSVFMYGGRAMELVGLLNNSQRNYLNSLRDQFLKKHKKGSPENEMMRTHKINPAWFRSCRTLRNILLVALYQQNKAMNSESFPRSKDVDQVWLQTLRPSQNFTHMLAITGVNETQINTIFCTDGVAKKDVRSLVEPAIEKIKGSLFHKLMNVSYIIDKTASN